MNLDGGCGGCIGGIVSVRCRISAIFSNIFLVSSPPSKLIAVGLGGAVSIRIIYVADWRRKLSIFNFGQETSWGGNWNVSVSLSSRVLGIKHCTHQ